MLHNHNLKNSNLKNSNMSLVENINKRKLGFTSLTKKNEID